MNKPLILAMLSLFIITTFAAECLPSCKVCNTADPTLCDECIIDYFQSVDKKSCIKLDYANLTSWPSLCSAGTKQSPIDIVTASVKLCPAVKQFYNVFSGQAVPITAAGQSLKAAYSGQSTVEYIMADATLRTYNSAQFHWHSPSQHTIDSKKFDLQLHVVHTVLVDGANKYAVAGFFFTVDPNIHADIFDRYNFNSQDPKLFAFPIDVRNKLVYHYEGSLTTPPCVEAVDFFLYTQPIPITKRNFQKMNEAINQGHHNARPVQALGGRTVQLMGSFCNTYNHI